MPGADLRGFLFPSSASVPFISGDGPQERKVTPRGPVRPRITPSTFPGAVSSHPPPRSLPDGSGSVGCCGGGESPRSRTERQALGRPERFSTWHQERLLHRPGPSKREERRGKSVPRGGKKRKAQQGSHSRSGTVRLCLPGGSLLVGLELSATLLLPPGSRPGSAAWA